MSTNILNLPTEETLQSIATALTTMQGNVSGVKGNEETTYRTGQVNLTAANIGALSANTTYVTSVNGQSGVITGLATTSDLNTVRLIAEGAGAAVSFATYTAMISNLNNAAATDYKVGQSIYIATLDVPDLWVFEVSENQILYYYTDDAAFKTLLANQGYVQVGYCKLAALETQKVDLTNYVSLDGTQTITGTKTFTGAITNFKEIRPTVIALSGSGANQLGFGAGQITAYNNIVPNSNNTSTLGSSTVKWKDLYLAGEINSNASGYGLTLPDTSGFTADKTIATNDIISDAYDNTATYAVGDCCIYNNTLYKCKTAITTAEDFNSTKWDAITITELISNETIVRTTGDQTVAGKKKFTGIPEAKEMIFRNNVSSPTGSALSIQNDNGYNAKIRFNNRGFMFTAGSVYPTDNNVMDFGATNYLWKNIYVSGNLSDGTNNVPVALLSGVSGAYATNSTTELKYETINNVSISANTTYTLATAPTGTYPEYKANITNTDTSNAITITLPSGTIIKAETGITVSSNTFTIPADTTVIVSIQDDLALVMIKG